MSVSLLVLILLAVSFGGFWWGRRSALGLATPGTGATGLHSLPGYYGTYVLIWCGLPSLLLLFFWVAGEDWIIRNMVVAALPDALRNQPTDQLNLLISDIRNMAYGNVPSTKANAETKAAVDHYLRLRGIGNLLLVVATLLIAVAGALLAKRRIAPEFRARNRVETVFNLILVVASTVAVFTTIGIVLSLLFEALRFFARYPVFDFLFGLTWSPQMAIRADQVGSSGSFGAVPLFAGTMLISVLAMLVAIPVGLMSAIYMSEYAPDWLRSIVKPVLEILAGIPTVVFGFFAALTVAPFIADAAAALGLQASPQSALAAGIVMGIMIIPYMSSLSDDVINAVPNSLREGSLGLGATRAETIQKVVLPAALPGIMAAFIISFSRALGETMIVVMAAGLAANITANPLDAATTVTVNISALLVGDQEFDSPKTLSAFALGLLLFLVTLTMNVFAQRIVKKYREQYD
jgi:phosphate transport system permease protein